MKEEAQHHLDCGFLDVYFKENIAPREFRIWCEPFFKNDNDFVKDWEDYLRSCSIELMRKLTLKRNTMLESLNKSINKLILELGMYKDHTSFAELDHRLTNRITHFERDILNKKSTKLLRDRSDYSGNTNIKY